MKPKPTQKIKRTESPRPKRKVAVYRGIDIVDDDHGGVCLGGYFEYEDGSSQSISQYRIDNEFLKRFLGVFNAEKLSAVNGKACWVVLEIGGDGLGGQGEEIIRLDPLIQRSGVSFDLEQWRDREGVEEDEGLDQVEESDTTGE